MKIEVQTSRQFSRQLIKLFICIFHKLTVFHFLCADKNSILKEIRKLNVYETSQDTNIRVRIFEEKTEFFAKYYCK